jgi:TonB family protein
VIRHQILVQILSALLAVTTAARSQTASDPHALMKELAEKYKHPSSYYFDFTTLTHTITEALRSKTDMSVEQAFVLAGDRTGRSFAEIGSPLGLLTFISDGKTKWTLAPQLKQFTKKVIGATTIRAQSEPEPFDIASMLGGDIANVYATQANMLLTQLPRIADRIKNARYLPEEKTELNGKETVALVIEVEYQSSLNGQSSRATFWVDKERHVIIRQVAQQVSQSRVGQSSTATVTTTFRRVELNQPVSDNLFAFRPPADAKEVERLDLLALSNPKPDTDLTGHEATDFTLKDLDGREVNLQSLKGKVVVLDFWATWCLPCLVELPHIEKLHKELKDSGVVFLGINDEEADTAREFMNSKGYTFASLVDTGKEVGTKYAIEVIPQTIVIDRTGKVVAHYFGTRNEDQLLDGLAKAGVPRPVKSVQASVSAAVRAEGVQEAMEPVLFSKAQPITRVDAPYPADGGGASGAVEVLVAISAAGAVVEALPISGNPLFQWNAMLAARKWTFKPILRDGKPVAAATVLTFKFTPPASQNAAPRPPGEGKDISASQEFGKGHYEQAVELYNQVKPGDRNYKNARYYLGLSYSRLERYRDAADVYRQLIDLEPSNLFAHYELGKASFKLGDQKTIEREQQFLSHKSPELLLYLNEYIVGVGPGFESEAPPSGSSIYEAGRYGAGKPTILYKENAKYTDIARKNLLQGTVVLSVIFTADGRITGIKVIRALPDGLTYRSFEAARKIRFQPAKKDGQPVDVRANLEFTFNLY